MLLHVTLFLKRKFFGRGRAYQSEGAPSNSTSASWRQWSANYVADILYLPSLLARLLFLTSWNLARASCPSTLSSTPPFAPSPFPKCRFTAKMKNVKLNECNHNIWTCTITSVLGKMYVHNRNAETTVQIPINTYKIFEERRWVFSFYNYFSFILHNISRSLTTS